jgi:hypothetical protein
MSDGSGRVRPLPDSRSVLICAYLTTSDYARPTYQAWHARGQGFESP